MTKRWIFLFFSISLLITLPSCGQSDGNEPPMNPSATISPTNAIDLAPTSSPTNMPTATQAIPEPLLDPALTAEDCASAGLPEIACTGVTANDQWEPVFRAFNGIEMALVPAGCFLMGNNNSLPEEQPVHRICFDQPFWIDRTEVTVSQFVDFLNDQPEPVTDHDRWVFNSTLNGDPYVQMERIGDVWEPHFQVDQRPLEFVKWIGANDFCSWREVRLPTEAEWEFSARGPDNNLYPWGNELIMDNIVRFRDRNPDVGSIPQGASWVGALDMSGSVFEWTSSLYRPYPYDAFDGREASAELDLVNHRVFRGCPWYHTIWNDDNFTSTARYDMHPDFGIWYYGLRCARSLDGN
jgi:formylglycine-generating enzyme required for sulfatase activity